MDKLHLMSPFEELTELRTVMTVQEIAEVTGIRRETLSRARVDGRFQRRTQKALDDLYAVVSRLGPTLGAGVVHLAAVMRRPQPALAERSIADLLREGRVDEVLQLLTPVELSEENQLGNPELDHETPARPAPSPSHDDARVWEKLAEEERRVAAHLATDPDLAARLPAIEARIREAFGDRVEIRRSILAEYDEVEGVDALYLGLRTGLSFDDEIERLGRFLVSSDDLLTPVRARLKIGNL